MKTAALISTHATGGAGPTPIVRLKRTFGTVLFLDEITTSDPKILSGSLCSTGQYGVVDESPLSHAAKSQVIRNRNLPTLSKRRVTNLLHLPPPPGTPYYTYQKGSTHAREIRRLLRKVRTAFVGKHASATRAFYKAEAK
jgi:hypothetical protein